MKSTANRNLIFLVALLGAFCFQTVHAQPAKAGASAKKDWGVKSLQIASAAQGGGFHALATPLAPIWEKDLGVPVVVSTSRGSNENVALIERGEVTLAMVTGASQAEAWNGEGSFKKPYRNGRLMFAFYPSNAFFFTKADSGMNSLKVKSAQKRCHKDQIPICRRFHEDDLHYRIGPATGTKLYAMPLGGNIR